MAKYDKNNCECPDKTPIEIPIGYTEPESLQDMIARLINANDFRQKLEAEGVDTPEEAEDFETDDDSEIKSEHEMVDMLDEFIKDKIMADSIPPETPAQTVPQTPATLPAQT